jgi:hypothetical protein
MTPHNPQQGPTSVGTTSNTGEGLRDEEISDEEANEEIDFPTTPLTPPAPVTPRIPKPAPAPRAAAVAADDTTPSVKVAIDKAADELREVRGEH